MDKKQNKAENTHTKIYEKDLFLLIEKNFTDNVILSGPTNTDSKFINKYVFNLHDPLDTIPLSKLENENNILRITEKITLKLLQKHHNLDPVIRQLKSWQKYETEPLKADTTILGNKNLLSYFRKFNDTSTNENTDILEYQTPDIKLPCPPLSMMLIAFHTSHSLHTKRHSGAEKTYSNFTQNFNFPNAPIWIKVLCNDCITCQLKKPYPNQKQIAEKHDFKAHNLYFNHRISFDTKGPISPSSEGNSYKLVKVDAFTHYVALNPVPHCKSYYAYTTLYEHWMANSVYPKSLLQTMALNQ